MRCCLAGAERLRNASPLHSGPEHRSIMPTHEELAMAVAVPQVDAAATGELRARFRGALLQPGHEGYDEARRIWNGAIDRRPVLIARCAGTDDVVEAVRFAREHDLVVSVRGGGH